jgi:phosphohistidine phosphatase
MPLTLHIIRHAKASTHDYFPGDFYRTLDKEGYAEAAAMAEWFAGENKRPDVLITSPAIRAYTTCLIFAEKISYPFNQVALNNSLYEAPYQKLLRVVQEQHDNCRTIAVFGHNPGLTDLANYLCGPIVHNLATAGVVTIELDAVSWHKATESTGRMTASSKP